jgi:hypothetical protein
MYPPLYQQQPVGGESNWNLNQPMGNSPPTSSQPAGAGNPWGPPPPGTSNFNNNDNFPRTTTTTTSTQQQQSPPPPPLQRRRPMIDPAQFHVDALQRDLDDAMHRERDLLAELRNRSSIVADLEQRERLHIHQLDVLSERVVTVEMTAARDRNEHEELLTNCTALAALLAEKDGEVVEWQAKCQDLLELKAKNEKRLQEWKMRWKSAAKEAEDLAIRIEEHHFGDEGLPRKQQQRQKKKRRGFFAWLFGFGGRDEDYDDNNNASVDDNDDYDALRERARTNLLTALRTERTAVSELESIVAALQQNNTAIAEQVKSRDRIIEELNDRIGVFEEDKVVLKAALKQLQKEMSDETPKLEDALKDIDRLTKQIKKLQSDHKKQLVSLQQVVQQKKTALEAAQFNLSTIGTYVDKLEERLADFTVAKRDIEKREAASKVAEERILKAENAKELLLKRVAELEEEQKDLTQALKELAEERSSLQNNTRTLVEERNEIIGTLESMRQTYATLDDESKKLRNANDQWAVRSEELERQLNVTLVESRAMQEKLASTETRITELQNHMDNVAIARQENQQALLADATAAQNVLQQRIAELEGILQEMALQHKQGVEALQQKLAEEVKQTAVGKEERVKLIEQLEQMSLKLIAFQEEKDAALQEAEKLKEQVLCLTGPLEEQEDSELVERIPGPRGADDAVSTTVQQQQPKLNARRRPGASIPQTTPPYLPRPADAPKRAFGQGIVNPQEGATEVPVGREGPIANVAVKQHPLNTTKSDTNLTHAAGVNTTLTVRKAPIMRGFRKFLSKRTGLHGVLTAPSSSSSLAGTKRKRDETSSSLSLSSSSSSSPMVVVGGNHTLTNSTKPTSHPPRTAAAAAPRDNRPSPTAARPPHR